MIPIKSRPALAALVLALPAVLAAQTPTPRRPPTFETGIEVVNLHVTVMDGRNRYITDLKEPDFAIFEDGIKQDLTLFNHEGDVTARNRRGGGAEFFVRLPLAQTGEESGAG